MKNFSQKTSHRTGRSHGIFKIVSRSQSEKITSGPEYFTVWMLGIEGGYSGKGLKKIKNGVFMFRSQRKVSWHAC